MFHCDEQMKSSSFALSTTKHNTEFKKLITSSLGFLGFNPHFPRDHLYRRVVGNTKKVSVDVKIVTS